MVTSERVIWPSRLGTHAPLVPLEVSAVSGAVVESEMSSEVSASVPLLVASGSVVAVESSAVVASVAEWVSLASVLLPSRVDEAQAVMRPQTHKRTRNLVVLR